MGSKRPEAEAPGDGRRAPRSDSRRERRGRLGRFKTIFLGLLKNFSIHIRTSAYISIIL